MPRLSHLVPIMGWASRHVLAWRLSNTLVAGFLVEAPGEALERCGIPDIFTTDQGCRVTGFALTERLQEAGIRISMDGRGRCMDDIFIERLWRLLECEAVCRHEIADGFAAWRLCRNRTGFHNDERPHPALGGRMPAGAYRNTGGLHALAATRPARSHLRWRKSTNRKIDASRYWRPEHQPEYTLTRPSGCPTNRGHLTFRRALTGCRRQGTHVCRRQGLITDRGSRV